MTNAEERRPGYTLDNAWEQARERLALLERIEDPKTVRHLTALGVAAGWRCLEVGGGGGSVVAWLCDRVGATGSVLVIDIDTRFLEILQRPNLAVRQHDVVTDPLPEAAFDLVHVRAVLMHLAERKRALAQVVSALKPGGWLLVEEPDFISCVPDPTVAGAALFTKGWAAARQVLSAAGADVEYGRRLYGDVCAAGLVDVSADGWVQVYHGGTPNARFWQLTLSQLHERIVGTGLLSDHEMAQFLALHDDPALIALDGIAMAVWGRRPDA